MAALGTPQGQDAPPPGPGRTALVLTGGGARAAYQVGVLRALGTLLPPGAPTPFGIVCGTSAGAINAAAIASDAGNFRRAVRRLTDVWRNFHAADVYRVDFPGMVRCAGRWLCSLVAGGLGHTNPVSLLDNAPLGRLLRQRLDLTGVGPSIRTGKLRALAITVSGYSSGHSISFFEARGDIPEWRRARRIGAPGVIGVEHLMASSAIPFLFPAVKLAGEYFGDGSIRQIAPLSPALHLGAERVLVVSLAPASNGERVVAHGCPSLAQIAGHALNSVFSDALEADLERLDRTNRAVQHMPPRARAESNLKHIDFLVLAPSEPLDRIAARHLGALPWTVRYFLRGIGAMRRSGSNLASYVLFERSYCRALMRLGYADTMRRREEIARFLGLGLRACEPPPALAEAVPLARARAAALTPA